MKKYLVASLATGALLLPTVDNASAATSEMDLGKEYDFKLTDGDGNNKNYHEFTLDQAGTVTIKGETEFRNTWLTILDSDGNEVGTLSEDGSEESPGKINAFFHLQADTYTIEVSSGYSGDYSLELNNSPANSSDMEPNNGTAEAQELSFGTRTKGFIARNDLVDYYVIKLEKAGRVDLKVEGYMKGRTNAEVLDSNNEALWWNYETSSAENPAQLNKSLYLEAGTYYIAINKSASDSYTGEYFVTANYTKATETYAEPNNGTAQAQPIEFGEVVNGFIAQNDETDYYSFKVTKPTDITLTVNGYLTDRTYAELLDSNYEAIWWNYDSSSPTNPTTLSTTETLEPGTYYFVVKGNGYYGEYNLNVTGEGITTFKDYQPQYWANAFSWGAKNNIINGDRTTNRLNPNKNITESQWLAMLLRYAYDAKDSNGANWYDSYYSLAKQKGISVANAPKESLRRGAVAKMLMKVYTGQNVSEQEAVQWLYDNEITTGVDPSKGKTYDNFNPNGTITRAHAITFMYRLFEKGITPQK